MGRWELGERAGRACGGRWGRGRRVPEGAEGAEGPEGRSGGGGGRDLGGSSAKVRGR